MRAARRTAAPPPLAGFAKDVQHRVEENRALAVLGRRGRVEQVRDHAGQAELVRPQVLEDVEPPRFLTIALPLHRLGRLQRGSQLQQEPLALLSSGPPDGIYMPQKLVEPAGPGPPGRVHMLEEFGEPTRPRTPGRIHVTQQIRDRIGPGSIPTRRALPARRRAALAAHAGIHHQLLANNLNSQTPAPAETASATTAAATCP